ncbi:MAG: hypothetical protein H6Q75_407, partial [Firmicutes bacterium]|nr:hypothetical protein [Bacillota bacterium]
MLRQFVADLHVHSLLSPCADVEMSPRNIIRQAVLNGIDIVAITDHNASANVRAFQQAAQGTGVTILPAMEVETKEEIHLVTLFEDSGAISAWENMVNQHLPDKKNDDNKFG